MDLMTQALQEAKTLHRAAWQRKREIVLRLLNDPELTYRQISIRAGCALDTVAKISREAQVSP